MDLKIFGDSHGDAFLSVNLKNSIPTLNWIWSVWQAPITMSRFAFENLNLINIKNGDGGDVYVNEGDIVCFCLGEIDCRGHLCKPENFIKYRELVDEIVPRYFEAIRLNVEQYQNLTTMVYNIVPTVKHAEEISNPWLPHIGSDEQRKEVTLYVNLKLKEYCKKYNYVFFDIYDKYCDKEGFLNPELKDSNIHIKNSIYIEEFLKNKIQDILTKH
jgi:hypothetical protein